LLKKSKVIATKQYIITLKNPQSGFFNKFI
jgi:hypothetical protein